MKKEKQENYYSFLKIDDERLTLTDELLYSVICNLSRQKGYCYASQKKLGEIIRKSHKTVGKCIGKLKYYEYLAAIPTIKEKNGNRYNDVLHLYPIKDIDRFFNIWNFDNERACQYVDSTLRAFAKQDLIYRKKVAERYNEEIKDHNAMKKNFKISMNLCLEFHKATEDRIDDHVTLYR